MFCQVPIVSGEQKSKPIQHSVQTLRAVGMSPDILVCRCKQTLNQTTIQKLSMFSMVAPSRIISVPDVGNIYEVPQLLLDAHVPELVLQTLNMQQVQTSAFD
jgi:CTP synthase